MSPAEVPTESGLLRGDRKAVDIPGIEKELASLWRDASKGPGPEGEAVTRACLWNTLVHTVDGAAADQVQEDLADLSMEIPSRAILIRTDAAAAVSDIDAFITANCRLTDDGRRHVCCEEIIISAKGRTMSELPSLVRGLLAPDVPSVLFWMEQPSLAGRHLADWLAAVDRFVIDSASFTNAHEFRVLLASARDMGRPVGLGDLNWHRLKPWRVLAARAFDQPGLRGLLLGASAVVVSGEPLPAHISGSLFMGWWAERLGFQAQRDRLLGASGNSIPVTFQADQGDRGPGGLSSIRFETGGSALVMQRVEDSVGLHIEGDLKGEIGLSVAAPRYTRKALWAREMEEYSEDPVLGRVLPRAVELLGGE
jgi:glucose-6-phosphate dehydrogenase assembly protein OpcA